MPAIFHDLSPNFPGDIPRQAHLCQFYETRQDLIDILIPFLHSGLKANELCVWMTPDILTTDEVIGSMRKEIPDIDACIDSGQLEVFPYSRWCSSDGAFDTQTALEGWKQKVTRALEKGYEGVRVTVDTMGLRKEDRKAFMTYENAIDDVIGDRKLTALCAYPLDRCGANEVIDIIGAHQGALVRRGDAWQVIESRGPAWVSKFLPEARGLKDYTDKLDDEDRRKLNIVPGNSLAIGQLIDDLLTFSRIGGKKMVKTHLDMEALVRDAWKDLTAANAGRRPNLVLNITPGSFGDEMLIRQLILNLLSNAIKFSSTRENPVVEVGAVRRCDTPIYYVRDNGVGVDMRYADRIFGLFQRLHSQEEFEGTGVGLAIVDRIVRRHGGGVRAEAKADEGAVFSFTLLDRE